MKTYYLMIHFGSGHGVNGFIAPNVENEIEAVKSVKNALLSLKKSDNKKSGELDIERIDMFLHSLKNYGKTITRSFGGGTKEIVEEIVRVVEITKPLQAGFWLLDIESNNTLCNIR